MKSNTDLLRDIYERYNMTEPHGVFCPQDELGKLEVRAYQAKRELLAYIGIIVTDGGPLRIDGMCADVRTLRAIIADIEQEFSNRVTVDIPGKRMG